MTFSETVTVEDGTPTLGASAGGGALTLACASGSGSATLVFSTDVADGASGLTGLAVVADSLEANGAAIVSAASGMAAELGHGGTEPTAAPGETVDAGPLTAAFEDVPPSHGGEAFTVRLRFGEAVALTAAMPVATGGTVGAVERATPGDDRAWDVTVTPAGGAGDVTVTLPARACTQAGAVCTADGRGLAAGVAATVPAEVPADAPFRMRLVDVPEEHDGTTPVVFEVAFTKNPEGYSYRTMRDETLDIRHGDTRRRRAGARAARGATGTGGDPTHPVRLSGDGAGCRVCGGRSSVTTPPTRPRKDVTDRCFSSHPGTTNVLSNSRWTNPKKYSLISLLKVVCLGHDVPALRRACVVGENPRRFIEDGSPRDRAVRAHRRDRGRRRCGPDR